MSKVETQRAREIRGIAGKAGWDMIDHQRDKLMLSFRRNFERINVYYSKMTVATCINHPKSGKTQLFRKKVGLGLLEKLFINPRHHTHKGYYEKNH